MRSLPAELASERDRGDRQRIGPYARRAKSAVDALTAAGVTTDELDHVELGVASGIARRATRRRPCCRSRRSRPSLQAKIDAAAAAYDKAVTPFAQDPSLVVDGVEMPLTDAYLAAHCPDLASSGVGDACLVVSHSVSASL